MTEYLIAFNDQWVPDHTDEELREKAKVVSALVAEMKTAGCGAAVGGEDRGRVWLAAGGTAVPGSPAIRRHQYDARAGLTSWRAHRRVLGISRRVGTMTGALRLVDWGSTPWGPRSVSGLGLGATS